MKIVVGADHGGFEMKEDIRKHLEAAGHEVIDIGCFSTASVDYPDYADLAVQKIVGGEAERGILVCGTGIGMSIAANRNSKIRAANCHQEYTAVMSREHNNANVLCLGARVIDVETALGLVDVWMATEFTGGRHQQRIAKFSD